ncbi:GlxA family transcriptional regulator [Haloglycomyces albus]|uniref:GlxA family transcriptional regulator n=1 Tax=Haloglycomyces albus TaxID=526067 RepID=UPI0004A357A2|nr:helix-turn-helix domain-containing protein [Haloglycomyces albus]
MHKTLVIALFPNVDLLDVTGPAEVFSLLARERAVESRHIVRLAAPSADPVVTAAGVTVVPDCTFAELDGTPIDTLVVPGAVNLDAAGHAIADVDPAVVAWIRRLARDTRRVTSVCVGAHVLAAAGLLEGRRVTTHWLTAEQLAREYPNVDVDPDPIFIRDGDVWTGAGVTACLDLSLALVAEEYGDDIALRIARQMVMYLKRPGGQSQFSVPLEPISASRRIDDLRRFVHEHATGPIDIADLARRAHVSERQLARIFKTELNTTPAAYIEAARVEIARNRLESTDDTLGRVARLSGFGSSDTLVRAFRRRLNTTPTDYRSRFRKD